MSVIYPKAKEALLQGAINLAAGNVKAVLVDTGAYTYSASHQYLSHLTGIVATSGNLANKSFTNGVFDADDVSFANVTGASIEAIVLYLDTGTASTSSLLAYLDVGTGLPVTPNGGAINVAWDNGANKIFAL